MLIKRNKSECVYANKAQISLSLSLSLIHITAWFLLMILKLEPSDVIKAQPRAHDFLIL